MGPDCKPVEEIDVECADSAAYVKERRTFLSMLGLGVVGVAGALFAAATHLAPPPNARPTPPPVAVTQPAAQPRPPMPAPPIPAPPVVVVTAPQTPPVVVYGQKTSVIQSNGVVITKSSNASNVQITAQPRAKVRSQVIVGPSGTVRAQPPRVTAEAQPDDSDF